MFLLIAFYSIPAFSQSGYTISGKIIDAATKQPLLGASVFAENTTIGTATNDQGFFTLRLPGGGYSIAVTFTGYQTETKRVTAGDAGNNEMVIEIKKKEKAMEEFVVKSTSEVADGLAKYGEFFLENFIGKTANSKECYIKNKEVLKFFYYRRTKRLKILATAPLEIVNDALGYTVKYQLDSFVHEYNTQVSLYTGNPLFQEMQSTDQAQVEKWNAARKVAFNGSILHFMRSMYNKKLKEEGFEIQFIVKNNEKETAVPVKNFYGAVNYNMDDSSKMVDIFPRQKEVAVIYKNEGSSDMYLATNTDASSKFQLSVLSFLPDESLNIEQNGFYFEQNDITINGYWAWEKVGDMLPYNFDFKEKTAPVIKEEVITPNVADAVKPAADVPQINESPLTAVTWKVDESKVIDGNSMLSYKRGAAENTINFDNDFYKFNTDNTGIYSFNAQDYKFNWKYLDGGKTKIEMTVLYPTPLIVNLENVTLSPTSLKYTRLQKVNGLNFVAIESRSIK
ncbi:MAG: carboxypeptidase-like regulatory domain-containing protein [Chitinophagaceae bacterium]|nr:carboxypeptidase-like regulatory domain-containing protein [Chitinophagaceae bacterium]